MTSFFQSPLNSLAYSIVANINHELGQHLAGADHYANLQDYTFILYLLQMLGKRSKSIITNGGFMVLFTLVQSAKHQTKQIQDCLKTNIFPENWWLENGWKYLNLLIYHIKINQIIRGTFTLNKSRHLFSRLGCPAWNYLWWQIWVIGWVVPLPSNSDHQEYEPCLVGDSELNLHLPLLLGRGTTQTTGK